MSDSSRIDDLRRRVQKDPASIAFAQLAEELRRAREYQEAADVCRSGLAIHPAYLSARVTLGRALVELGQLDEAQVELLRVLESAPENLAAIRGLAEIYHRRGDLAQALTQYRAALTLARNDPDLEETIAELARQVEPAQAEEAGRLTLKHMQHELSKHAPPVSSSLDVSSEKGDGSHFPPMAAPQESLELSAPEKGDGSHFPPMAASPESIESSTLPEQVLAEMTPVPFSRSREARTVEALEQWLDALHVARAGRTA